MRSIHELFDLSGRVAAITGGAGHIGQAIADALAEAKADVAILDLPGGTESCARRIRDERGVRTLPIDVDLSDPAALTAIPDRIVSELGRLDILVNCAALVGTSGLDGWAVPFEQQGLGAWNAALRVNLTAPFVLVQSSLPHLRRGGHGAILNIGSIYGVSGPDWRLYEGTALGNPAAYAASKGGLVQLTRWLATTLAPDVRVNALSPGGVFRGTQEPFLSRYTSRTPMGRMATEEDMKGAALFLVSDAAGYVTGQNILVDGGWTAW